MKRKSKHIALGIALLVVAVLIYGFAMWHYTENYRAKLWLHRCNSLEKLHEHAGRFEGVEVDLVYRDSTRLFDVTHDTDVTFGLDIAPYFRHAAESGTRLWLDLKNLTPQNAAAVERQLSLLCTDTGCDKSRFIVESRDADALAFLTARGYYTSYYVPHDKPSRLSSTRRDSCVAAVQAIAASGKVRAISFPGWWYAPLKGKIPDEVDMLTWLHRSVELEVRLWPGYLKILEDPQIKVVLIKSKGKYHR